MVNMFSIIRYFSYYIFQTKALGDTALTLTAAATMDGTTVAEVNTHVITQINLIENAINNIATPSCTS